MNTTLYLIRHGKLENPDETIYDHTIHLSKEGESQMERLGQVLQKNGVNPEVIVTSPYDRAVRSSEMLRRSFPHIPIVKDVRLQDTLAPKIVGKKLSWLKEMGDVYLNPELVGYEIEKREDIEARMLAAIHDVTNKYEGKTILMVSHGDPTAFAMWRLMHPKGEVPSLDIIKNSNGIPDYLEKGEGWKISLNEHGKFINREHVTSRESIVHKEREL